MKAKNKTAKKSVAKAKPATKVLAKASGRVVAKVNASAKKLVKKSVKIKAKSKAPSVSVANLSNEKVGILGGSFNPIHSGHLNVALSSREKLALDYVALVPTFNAPHRPAVTMETKDRLDMVMAAIKNYQPELRLDDQEFKRGGTSYSVDTLEAYNKTHKAENLYFIMGADAFMEFPRWKNFEKLLTLANFVVVTRPGSTVSLAAVDLPSGLEQYVKASDNNHVILSSGRSIIRLELDDIDVSSTDLRKKLRNNFDVTKWIPEKTLEIINERGLYKRSSPLVKDYQEFAFFCANQASDKKALDLKIYDMTKRSSYADYSIICSATSSRHGSAVAQGILDLVKEEFGLSPISIEGLREGMWVLVDYGAVVIHVFQDVVRQQYRIEDLWRGCPQIQKEANSKRPENPRAPLRGLPRER